MPKRYHTYRPCPYREHHWVPVARWSGRYKCRKCKTLGYKGLVTKAHRTSKMFEYTCPSCGGPTTWRNADCPNCQSKKLTSTKAVTYYPKRYPVVDNTYRGGDFSMKNGALALVTGSPSSTSSR